MENVSFIRYSPHDETRSFTDQVVECYREVFSDRPWNEWLKCPVCQKYWGIKDRELLESWDFQHCGFPLVDFWPREQVMSDIYHEITPEASCWLAVENSNVIGFCWGYPITISDLEEKLGVFLQDEIKKTIGDHELVAYQDEVGVVCCHRKRKIAKAMVSHRLDDFLAKGLKIGIVRTRQYPEQSETFLWYKKLNYHTIASYPNGDGRVILGRSIVDLKELL